MTVEIPLVTFVVRTSKAADICKTDRLAMIFLISTQVDIAIEAKTTVATSRTSTISLDRVVTAVTARNWMTARVANFKAKAARTTEPGQEAST